MFNSVQSSLGAFHIRVYTSWRADNFGQLWWASSKRFHSSELNWVINFIYEHILSGIYRENRNSGNTDFHRLANSTYKCDQANLYYFWF